MKNDPTGKAADCIREDYERERIENRRLHERIAQLERIIGRVRALPRRQSAVHYSPLVFIDVEEFEDAIADVEAISDRLLAEREED